MCEYNTIDFLFLKPIDKQLSAEYDEAKKFVIVLDECQ